MQPLSGRDVLWENASETGLGSAQSRLRSSKQGQSYTASTTSSRSSWEMHSFEEPNDDATIFEWSSSSVFKTDDKI